ncbi:MAG: paraquat-inducible protein A [Boseongicola sp.]
MRVVVALLLLVASFTFALGISLPIVHFEKLYFLTESPSLIGIVTGLWSDGSLLIAAIVLLFSILFPLVKLVIVFIAAVAPETLVAHKSVLRHAGTLSKWSMMDVLLVALVIFAAKTSGLANAFAQPGLWFYATSAIAGAIAAGLLKRQQKLDQDGSLRPGS